MIIFLFVMVMILAITVCASVLSGRIVSRDIKDLQDENKKPKLSILDVHRAMEDRLGDFQRHVMLSVKKELEAVGHEIDKTDQAVRAIEKAMTHDKKARYRADAEIAALNFSDYQLNRVLSIDVGPSSPSGSDRFKKGDFICMTGKDKRFEYWKCIVADSDSAVFGKVLYHRVTAPGKCSVSWADIFITHSACSLIGHRVDSLPDIG